MWQSPCIVLGKLRSAAAPGALKGAQLVAAAAALAEALQEAGAHEGWGLDVHVADAALLVVGAERAQVPVAALYLAAGPPRRCLLAVKAAGWLPMEHSLPPACGCRRAMRVAWRVPRAVLACGWRPCTTTPYSGKPGAVTDDVECCSTRVVNSDTCTSHGLHFWSLPGCASQATMSWSFWRLGARHCAGAALLLFLGTAVKV